MTKKQAFSYEYGRQRFIGSGVIVAAWRALLAAFDRDGMAARLNQSTPEN